MSLYESLLRPLFFSVPPETAHEFGLTLLRAGLGIPGVRSLAASRYGCREFGKLVRFGLEFSNPLGIAAGFDKNGLAVNHLAALGFGFVEVGTVTHSPQLGNPKPRLFRLPADEALVNRLGFNNRGAVEIAGRLSGLKRDCVLGVNIGKSRDVANEDAVADYLETFKLVRTHADYIAINVSSPNTPGLRDLQSSDALNTLLSEIQKCNGDAEIRRPLLLKIAPDLDEAGIESVVEAAAANGIEGIIATNTSTSRENLKTDRQAIEKIGPGGLSGRPLARRSCEVIRSIYRMSEGKITIIGVGGVFSGRDAYDKICAGASLLQAYTGFVYKGPAFARKVNDGLACLIRENGFRDLDEAVGSAAV